MVRCTPIARRLRMSFTASSGSRITMLSVISSSRMPASVPVDLRISASWDTSCSSRNWMAERLTAAGILPGLGARADLAQRPQADRNDQTRFLGEMDEFLREQQAPLGVLPAQQRFDPRDRACGHVDLGLVVHAELAPLQAVPQAGLQGELLRRVRLQLGGVEAESVAAPVLGAVHGDVRS